MARFKFGNTKVYVVPGSAHKFRTEHDARFYCEQNGIDFSLVEKYDSKKEYDRWRELQMLEKNGNITNLRRQVEYEIIPAHYEDKIVRYKSVKSYLVKGFVFGTKTAARDFCKAGGIPSKTIVTEERTEPVIKSVCVEKNAVYTADFVYTDENGKEIVEDVKSDITRKEADYVLRRKLMLFIHKIKILET